jgi:hypothetical protein
LTIFCLRTTCLICVFKCGDKMKFRALLIVLLGLFWAPANANFSFDDRDMSHVVVPFSSPNIRYELTTLSTPKAPIPQLKLSSHETSKFLEGGFTYEEKCMITSLAPSCVNVTSGEIYAFDPDVQAIAHKGQSPLRIFKDQTLQLNNCTIISEGPIVLEGNKVKVQGFFKTPHSLTICAMNRDLPISQISLIPDHFKFGSSIGVSLTNSSFYAAIDINFEENQYTVCCQGASSLSIGDPFSNDTKDSESSLDDTKKHKSSSIKSSQSKRQKKTHMELRSAIKKK